MRRVLAVVIFVTLLPLVGLVELDLHRQIVSGRERLPVEAYRLPPPAVLRALCFGYNELAADLLWVRTIAYFADHLLKDRDLRHLRRHLSNILALDDRFKEIYRYGASMTMSIGDRRTNEDILWAIVLLQKGHQRFPDDWRIPLNIGIYYLNDLQSKDRTLRAKWRRQGADWVTLASLVGADIPWLPSLAARIYTEQGQRELAIQRLEELYLISQDEKTRAQITAKLKNLQVAKLAADLQTAAQAMEKAHRDSPLRFVPADLFIFLRQDRLPPFSLEHLFRRTD